MTRILPVEDGSYRQSGDLDQALDDRLNEGASIAVLNSIECLRSVRYFWEETQACPAADYSYFINQIECRIDVAPCIISLCEGNSVKTLLVGRIQSAPLGLHFGYRLLGWPRVRMLEIVEGGILGEYSEASCRSLLNAATEMLAQGKAEIVAFRNLPLDSLLYQTIRTRANSLRFGTQRATLWKLALPNSYREFLHTLSRRTRATSVRYSNLLAKKYGMEKIAVQCFRKIEEIDIAIEDTETVAQKAWQRGVRKGFVNDKETRQEYEIAAKRNQLWIFILYLAGTPVAFWHGLGYGHTFFAKYTAFDPAYVQDRPGIFLLDRMIEEFCRDKIINFIDFGWGDHDYKRHYCRQGQDVADLHIYAPGLYGLALNSLKSGFDGTKTCVKALFRHARILDRLRKYARERAKAAVAGVRTTD